MIFRNSLALSLAKILGYVFSLVLAPVMLAQLGLAEFGVWAVTGAITTYAGLMDLGVTRAIGRFVAFYDARDDRFAVQQVFGLGLIVVTIVAAIAAAAATVAAPFVNDVLGDVLSMPEMRAVLLSAVAIFALNAYRYVMKAVPEGMQQMVPTSIAEFVGNAVNFVFSLVALLVWGDLVIYALANVAAAVVALVPTWIAVRSVWRPVRVSRPSRPIVNEVLGFSVKTQLSWIGDLVNNQTDKIIIAVFIDVRAAAAYELANRAINAVKSIAVLSIGAMVPAATAGIAREGTGIVGEFYRRYTMRSLAVALPLLVFTSASAPALLVAWLGDVPQGSVLVFIALALANCVNLSTGVAFSLSLGEGKAGMIAVVSGITVALNIVFTLLLTPFFGLWGVIAGTVVGIVGGSAVFLVYFHRTHAIPAVDYLRAAAPPALVALGAAVPVVLWLVAFPVEDGERWPSLIATAALAAVYGGLFWTAASRAAILPTKLLIRRLVPTSSRS